MVDLRAKTEAEYRDLIFITNAYAMTNDDIHAWDPLLNVLNEDINYYEKTVFAGNGSSSGNNGGNSGDGGDNGGSGDNSGDTPDTPDTPDNPGTPDNPETPETPETPDTPDNPGGGDNPPVTDQN